MEEEMIPLMKTPEDIEKAIDSLPFVAKVERQPLVKACKKALSDLVAIGKVDGQRQFSIEMRLEPYLRP
jgi:hypothetical protein